jgi:GTPase SAR1 family protein
MAMAKKLDAADYVECSALTNEGVREVFDKVVAVATKEESRPIKNLCCLL